MLQDFRERGLHGDSPIIIERATALRALLDQPEKSPEDQKALDDGVWQLWQLTPAQEAAADRALAEQQKRIASEAEAKALATRDHANWQRAEREWLARGGKRIEELLVTTPLVDLKWVVALVEAGGVVPRAQEVPDAAKITPERSWRIALWLGGIAVLVLSYPWLDWWHPDRNGAQLCHPHPPPPPPSPTL